MSTRNRPAVLLLAALAPLAVVSAGHDAFADQFPIADCDFQTRGGNAFLILQPGRQLYLSNKFCDNGKNRSAHTRVLQEFETTDGELEEVSLNYVASCAPMNDVYYFGEDVFDGDGEPLPDAWLAGRDGARPGILLPDRAFLLGSRYYQELAPNAQDRSEHTSMGFEVEVPAGVFQDCVEIPETSPLEQGHESLKTYCPNVGIVRDGDLELIRIYKNARPPGGGEVD